MFARLGPWCHDHRRMVVVGWVVLLFVANGVASAVGEAYRQDFSLDGFESTDGFALVETAFDDGSGSPQSGQIVFQAEQGVHDPEVQAAMEQLFAEVAETVPDSTVVSPYAPEGARQISQDGTIAYAEVNLAERPIEEYLDAADQVKAAREQVAVSGLTVELGGDIFAEQSEPAKGRSS